MAGVCGGPEVAREKEKDQTIQECDPGMKTPIPLRLRAQLKTASAKNAHAEKAAEQEHVRKGSWVTREPKAKLVRTASESEEAKRRTELLLKK